MKHKLLDRNLDIYYMYLQEDIPRVDLDGVYS